MSHGRERRFSILLTVYTRGNFQGRKWFGITASQRRLSRGSVPTASFCSVKMFTISGSICQYLAGEVVAGIGLKQARTQCVHAIVQAGSELTMALGVPCCTHPNVMAASLDGAQLVAEGLSKSFIIAPRVDVHMGFDPLFIWPH